MSLLLPSWRCQLRKYDSKKRLISFSSFVPNSVVQAWIGCLSAQFISSSISVKDVENATRSIFGYSGAMYLNAGTGNSTFGIVCGTGTDAVSINDYKLQSLIQSGTGTGQLQYSGVEFPNKYLVDTATALTDIRRFFTNNSGATVNIKEIGIYCNTYNNYKFCIERTLINEKLADTESLEVTYRLSKTI